jgi:hypothetical protein
MTPRQTWDPVLEAAYTGGIRNAMSNARAIRYRRLALAQEDKATADLLLKLAMNAIGIPLYR